MVHPLPVQIWVIPEAARIRRVLQKSGLKPVFDHYDDRALDLDALEASLKISKSMSSDAVIAPFVLKNNTSPTTTPEDTMPANSLSLEIPITTSHGVAVKASAIPFDDENLNEDIDCIAGATMPSGRPVETFPVSDVSGDDVTSEEEDALVFSEDNTLARREALFEQFRCLGYDGDQHYFLPRAKGQVIAMRASNMRETAMVELADIAIWRDAFGYPTKQGRIVISWSDAIAFVLKQSHNAGIWDPTRVAGIGCWHDGDSVVANFGEFLYLGSQDLVAVEKYEDQISRKVFIKALKRRHPDFTAIMKANDPRVTQFSDIISSIRWRDGTEAISLLNFLGWICMAPICGVVTSKPYAWLTGPANSGKTWIVKNIVLRALGDFCINSATSTSVAGLRNHLQGNALPVIFDMVDFSRKQSAVRLSEILELARQSANDVTQEAVHFEAIPGGGANRSYSLSSTFFFSSQMPDAERSSDLQGAARISLGRAHDRTSFLDTLERPVEQLLDREFSLAFIGRMIARAHAMTSVLPVMADALSDIGMGEGQKKIHTPLAASAWLFLEDGVPRNKYVARNWLLERFGDIPTCLNVLNADRVDPWQNILRTVLGKNITVHTDAGTRTEAIGNLLQIVGNIEDEAFADITPREASATIQRFGLRLLNSSFRPIGAQDRDKAAYLCIHPSSSAISEILSKLNFGDSYSEILMDAPSAERSKKTIRFGPLGPARGIIIPVAVAAPGVFDGV